MTRMAFSGIADYLGKTSFADDIGAAGTVQAAKNDIAAAQDNSIISGAAALAKGQMAATDHNIAYGAQVGATERRSQLLGDVISAGATLIGGGLKAGQNAAAAEKAANPFGLDNYDLGSTLKSDVSWDQMSDSIGQFNYGEIPGLDYGDLGGFSDTWGKGYGYGGVNPFKQY